MKIIGVICEYNPFHRGHRKQFECIRNEFGEDCGIVCLMSGNFVQRGAPAIMDKSLRAEAAIRCGADLMLELPTVFALSSAEGFASGGVGILSGFCDALCFGTETGNRKQLMETAAALRSPEFSALLREKLKQGISFPAARQSALEQMGQSADLLIYPNDILAVEYCKAIVKTNAEMKPFPIRRLGGYHDMAADYDNPSATALRKRMTENLNWKIFVPPEAAAVFEHGELHDIKWGELAVLSRLRSMSQAEFEGLPYGSEGLWRKLQTACRRQSTLEEILTATKSKRYTRTRLNRMVMCGFLGITGEMMQQPVPYTRVLALSDTGREILKKARCSGSFLHTGEKTDHPLWNLEQRWDDLYGLFAASGPEKPGREEKRRIIYIR